jgi:hypothetical protein
MVVVGSNTLYLVFSSLPPGCRLKCAGSEWRTNLMHGGLHWQV